MILPTKILCTALSLLESWQLKNTYNYNPEILLLDFFSHGSSKIEAHLPLLAFWNLDVTPSTIDHVSLEEHLEFQTVEPENVAFM